MSITYLSKRGDTFSSIARQTLGSDTYAADVQHANPGVREPLKPNLNIRIPRRPTNTQDFLSQGLDIMVDNVRIGSTNEFTLTSSIDGMRKGNFKTPNEHQTRELTPPLEFLDAKIGYNGKSLANGYITTANHINSGQGLELQVPFSSRPAILETSPPDISSFPLDFRKLDLQQITEQLAGGLSVSSSFPQGAGSRFNKVQIQQTQPILPFLAELSFQRNLMYSDDAFGTLVCWDGASDGAPVMSIDDDRRPDVIVTPNFNAGAYYSEITCVLRSRTGRARKSVTAKNPFWKGPERPHSIEVKQSDDGELQTAVDCAMGRMFAQAFNIQLTIPDWEANVDGDTFLVEPKFLIKLRSPKNRLPEYTEMIVRNITYNKTPQSLSATMLLSLDTYGRVPESLPWLV